MGYTGQDCEEYATCVLGAALASNHAGPVYIQGDHFQTKPKAEGVIEEGEVEKLKLLIDQALQNGIYNIDIDASTLVNLSAPTLEEQQKENIKYTLELAKYVREKQPKGIEVSIGGEIGHIGGKNSTLKELDTFLTGFYAQWDKHTTGLSKVSIQSGTSHGGNVMSDGKVHPAEVDFVLLENAGDFVRSKFSIGGVVQHGASTQPHDFFSQLPQHKVLEVHLATGLQNAVFDAQSFPQELKKEMYAWIKDNKQDECKADWSEDQFMYKLRKKCWGTFKQELWDANLDLTDLNTLLLGYFSVLNQVAK
jgi:fructose/tagatose bisphosphate aldolase